MSVIRRRDDWTIQVAACAAFLAAAVTFAQARSEPPRNEATFRAVLAAAREPNRDVRCEAAWALGRMGRVDAQPALEALVADAVPEVRAAALRALADLLPRGGSIVVTMAVPVEDPITRRAALVAAGNLLFNQREELIRRALAGEDPLEKIMALEALRLTPSAAAKPLAEAALKEARADVRAAALRAFGLCAGAGGAAQVVPFLVERSSSESFAVRAAACDALREMKPPKPPPALLAAAADEHFLVRRAAIRAIVATGDPAALPAAQTRIADSDYTVRLTVCKELGEFIDGSSAPLLAKRLADEVSEVRDVAAASLALFPPETVFACLGEYLDDAARVDSRRRAWRLLGEYAYPPSADAACAHLRDADGDVLGCAFRVMRKLSDRRAIPRVVELLTFTADKMPPPEAAAEEAFRMAIMFELKEPVPSAMYVLGLACSPVPPMQPFMPSAGISEWSAHYLAALDQKQAVPLLEKIYGGLKTDDSNFARAVSAALEKLTGQPHPLAPPPSRAEVGHYFIDVPSAAEKPGK